MIVPVFWVHRSAEVLAANTVLHLHLMVNNHGSRQEAINRLDSTRAAPCSERCQCYSAVNYLESWDCQGSWSGTTARHWELRDDDDDDDDDGGGGGDGGGSPGGISALPRQLVVTAQRCNIYLNGNFVAAHSIQYLFNFEISVKIDVAPFYIII